MKREQHEQVQHKDSGTWKKCNMKRVQHEKSPI